MCRHLAYLGPPRTLSQVLLEPEHGLLEQSWAPADMRGGGTINADGFGAGWYPPVPPAGDGAADPVAAVSGDGAPDRAVRAGAAGVPVRMRSAQPIWSDTSFAAVARVTAATGVLAAVRAASPGMPVVSTANAPFTEDRWLFSHNGMVFGWPDALEALGATLPVLDLMTLDAPSDAALLWALVRHRLRAGHDPGDGPRGDRAGGRGGRARVAAEPPAHRRHDDLGDGLAARAGRAHHRAHDRRSRRVGHGRVRTDGCAPGWTQVPDRHLVVARPGRHDMHPLEHAGAPGGPRAGANRGSTMTTESPAPPPGTTRRPPHRGRLGRGAARRRPPRTDRHGPRSSRRSGSTTPGARELFEQITDLPEYYPFRTERALLTDSVADIAHTSGAETVVELGSGSSTKTRLLLDAFLAEGTLRSYVPQDVSESALRGAWTPCPSATRAWRCTASSGTSPVTWTGCPAPPTPGGRRMVAFLGGTIGNLLPGPRHEFLTGLRAVLEPGEQLLLGTGLVIDPAVLVPAYDDAPGVTAEFNRNVLHVLNRELDADFDVDAFAHVALWDAEHEWIEMRLRAEREMTVRVAGWTSTSRSPGEQMRTEVSAKFRHEAIGAMVAAAGFELTRRWTDPDERYALSLATAVDAASVPRRRHRDPPRTPVNGRPERMTSAPSPATSAVDLGGECWNPGSARPAGAPRRVADRRRGTARRPPTGRASSATSGGRPARRRAECRSRTAVRRHRLLHSAHPDDLAAGPPVAAAAWVRGRRARAPGSQPGDWLRVMHSGATMTALDPAGTRRPAAARRSSRRPHTEVGERWSRFRARPTARVTA